MTTVARVALIVDAFVAMRIVVGQTTMRILRGTDPARPLPRREQLQFAAVATASA